MITLNSKSSIVNITNAFNSVYSNSVASILFYPATHMSPWLRFQITLSATASRIFGMFSIVPLSNINTNTKQSVYVFTQLDYNNYPLFYDWKMASGYRGSGKYTCYLRHYLYNPWSYYTGLSNTGVIAEV